MTRLSGLLAVSLLLSTGACASVPRASLDEDRAAKQFAPVPGRATLYVYRHERMGAAVRMSVVLDGGLLGDTSAGTYLFTPVEPGRHTVTGKAENDSSVDLEMEAGKAYFVWQEVKMGMWSARNALQEVDSQRGKERVLACELAKTTAPHPAAPAGCSKDTDCKGERICRAGACVEPPLATN